MDEVDIINKKLGLSHDNYKEVWDKVYELIFVMKLNDKFFPDCFIDFNDKICSNLGYSKEEFSKLQPLDILEFDKIENLVEWYKNLVNKKFDKVEMMLKSKSKKHIYVKANISILNNNKENYILVISTDITEYKKLEEELKGILNGIPDVIKVYNPDYTISFFNEAGYDFYKRQPQEVHGKKCYEILDRKDKCMDCSFEEVVKTKQMISRERYIPELNKFMDVCYNPVIDKDGDVLFVVERLRDITEKKYLDKILNDSKERYKQVINSSPDAVIIIVDNKIVLANDEACNLFRVNYSNLIDSNIYKYFQEKYKKALHKKFRTIISEKKVKETYDYEFNFLGNKLTNLQISYSYINYEGKSAIIAVVRDITEMKQELTKAAEFQRKTLQKSFPAQKYVDIVSTYVPANTISGDFYRIYEISQDLIIGIVMDVRGKGVSAALNISAFDVLCFQEVAINHEPMDIIKNLNKKMVDYYEENYIAVCCFSMDFSKNKLNVVGAGMNQFIFQGKEKIIEEKVVEGPFLGMFENSEFCEQIINFESGDKVFFFTDGLDFILDEDKIIQQYMKDVTLFEFKKYIDEFLNDTILEDGKLKDDCTMIAIEIK